jgi:hypothetical protein
VRFSTFLAFHAIAGAGSSVEAFEAIIVVSTEGCMLVNQHSLEGVAVFEALTRIRVSGRFGAAILS